MQGDAVLRLFSDEKFELNDQMVLLDYENNKWKIKGVVFESVTETYNSFSFDCIVITVNHSLMPNLSDYLRIEYCALAK